MSDLKRCPDCKESKPRDEFGRNSKRPGGLQPYCKLCTSVRDRVYRQAHADQRRAYMQAYRNANRERLLANDRAYRGAHANRRNASDRAYRDVVRAAAIAALGGRCAECGTAEGLEVDHVNGDGKAHRKSASIAVYTRQIADGSYDGPPLQLLCSKHHRAKTLDAYRTFLTQRKEAS